MSETHYLISDASKKVDVESHVLRYWEEELEMAIPRNEMGHRYYTDFHIRLFKQIKELKEKGYQLKAIKAALAKSLDQDGEAVIPTDVLEEDVVAALKECTDQESREMEKLDDRELTELMAKERAEQFKDLMSQMIGQAIEENNEKLSQDISRMVNDKVLKEIDYLMRVADERDEERFRQLDETIRLYQREGKDRAEAAASKTPFFPPAFHRKKKFGRKGNKNSSNPRKRKTLGGLEEGIDHLITTQRTRRSAFGCSGTGFHGQSSAFCPWRQERPAGSGRRYRC